MNAPFSVVVGLHVAPPRGGVVGLLSHHDHAAASSSSTLCFLHENADDVSAITGVGALPRSSAEPHQHQHQRVSGLPAVSVSTPYVLIEEREGTDNCNNTSGNNNHNNNNDRHYSSAGRHDLHAFASDMSSAIADELLKSTAQEVVTAAVGGSGTGKSHLILGPSFSTSSASPLVGSNSSSSINSTRSIFSATLHRIFSQRPQAVVALSAVQVSDGDPLSAVSALERRTTCIDLLSGLRDTLYPQPLRRHNNNNNNSHNSQHQHASSGDNRPSRTSPTGCFMADCADVPATQYVRCRSPAEAERVLAEALSSSASWQPHTTAATTTGERDAWLLRPRVGSGSHMLITLLIQPHPHGGVNVWKLWDLAGPVTMTTHVGSQPQRTLEGLRLVSHAAARRGASSKQQQQHPHSNDAALAATVHACRCADPAAQLIHASCAESASLLVLIASLRDDGDMDIVNHTALRVAEGWRSAGAASQARHAMGLRNGDGEEADATARRARRRRENSEAAARVLAHFAVDASRYYCIGGGGGCSQAGSRGSSRHGGDAVSAARQSQGSAHKHSRSPRHHPDASAGAAVIRSPWPADALSIDVTNLDMGTAAPSTVLRDAATTTTRSSNASAHDANAKWTRTTTTLSAAEGAAREAVWCEEEATSRFAFLRRSSQDQEKHGNKINNISDGSPPHARQRSPHTPPSITRTARPPQPPQPQQQRCLADPVQLFGAVENRENNHARFDNTAAAEDDGNASTSVRSVVSQLRALLTTIQAEQHDWLVAQSAALADISDIIQNRSHHNSSSNNDNNNHRPEFSDDSSTGGNETGDRYRVEDTSSSSSEVSRLRLRVQWLEQQLVASHQRAQACQAHSAHLPSTAQLLRLLERLNMVSTTTTAAAIHEDDESHLESNSVTIRPAAVPCSTTTISRHYDDDDVNNNIHNERHSTPPPPAETVFTHGVDAQQVDTDAYDDRNGAEYRPHASSALAPATDGIFPRADASSWRSVHSTPTATPIREATLNVSYDATASNDHAITNTTTTTNNKHDQLRALLSKAFVRERTPTHAARVAGRDDYHCSLLSGVGCDADGGGAAAAVLVELTPDRLGADDGDEIFNQSATSMSSYNKSRHIELHNNNNAVVTTSCSHPHAASEAVALTSHCTTTAAMAPTTTLDMVTMEDNNSRPTILPLLQSAIAHLQDCALEAGAGAGAAGGAEERLYSAVAQLQVAAREADKVLRDASGREREYLSNILYS